jgi:hypothetical protein
MGWAGPKADAGVAEALQAAGAHLAVLCRELLLPQQRGQLDARIGQLLLLALAVERLEVVLQGAASHREHARSAITGGGRARL